MKRAELFHPVVFSDKKWVEGYYKRNGKNIERVGKRFAKLLKNSGFKGGKILDTGCGFGAIPIVLAKQFPDTEIIGIDLSKPLLELAQSLATKAGVKKQISFSEGDVHKLDFGNDYFDVLVNSFMSHIVDDPVLMFNEIERVAKPGGKIMITDLRRIWLGRIIKKLRTSYTLEEAEEVISKSNLRQGKYSKGPFWWDYMVGIE